MIYDILDSKVQEFTVHELQQKLITTQGQSFGELALMNKKPRAATITCLKECHFATLDRDNYQSTLEKAQK